MAIRSPCHCPRLVLRRMLSSPILLQSSRISISLTENGLFLRSGLITNLNRSQKSCCIERIHVGARSRRIDAWPVLCCEMPVKAWRPGGACPDLDGCMSNDLNLKIAKPHGQPRGAHSERQTCLCQTLPPPPPLPSLTSFTHQDDTLVS